MPGPGLPLAWPGRGHGVAQAWPGLARAWLERGPGLVVRAWPGPGLAQAQGPGGQQKEIARFGAGKSPNGSGRHVASFPRTEYPNEVTAADFVAFLNFGSF